MFDFCKDADEGTWSAWMPNRLLEKRGSTHSSDPASTQGLQAARPRPRESQSNRAIQARTSTNWAYLFQQLVRHFLSLELLEELLTKLLEAGKRPLCRQLGAVHLLLVVTVHGDVEVEARGGLSSCSDIINSNQISSYVASSIHRSCSICL